MSAEPDVKTPWVRRALRALGVSWMAGVVVNLVFVVVVGESSGWRAPVTIVVLLLGAFGGWLGSRQEGPWQPGDVREGPLGWAIVGAIVFGLVAAVALPDPWGAIPAIPAFMLMTVYAFDAPDAEPAGDRG